MGNAHPCIKINFDTDADAAPGGSSSSTAPPPTLSPLPAPAGPKIFEDPVGADFGEVVDMLVAHGVPLVDANIHVYRIVRNGPTTIQDLSGRGGLCK